MRQVTPGFSVPEQRMASVPFYYSYPPEGVSWEWLHWPYDARQRKFYEVFTGRTQGSIWMDECNPTTVSLQGDVNARAALMSDSRAWSMPHIDVATGYLGEAAGGAFSNYLNMVNYRPSNPYSGWVANIADIDELYIAPRVALPRLAMRVSMRLPTAATLTNGLDCYVGFEVNRQGGHEISCLNFNGTANAYRLQHKHIAHRSTRGNAAAQATMDFGGAEWGANDQAVTINNVAGWATYYFVYDPPVFRFVQPDVGQTDPFSFPDMTEVSVMGVPDFGYVQPFIANESTVVTSAAADTWFVGHWSIWPLNRQSNSWVLEKRTNPETGNFEVIWDTGGRAHVNIHITSIAAARTWQIYSTGEGEDQAAGYPEVRTWRRIDDADWTGVTDAGGIASMGLFNASRFLKIVLTETSGTGTQCIYCTANGGDTF